MLVVNIGFRGHVIIQGLQLGQSQFLYAVFDDAIARSLERTAVVKINLTEPPVGKRKQYDKEGEELKWGRME